eukprot:PhM_4_TR15700/c5_g1_i4/m.84994
MCPVVVSLDEADLLLKQPPERVHGILKEYSTIVEGVMKRTSGKVAWVCETEISCRFEVAAEAQDAALKMELRLRKCSIPATIAIGYGDLYGVTIRMKSKTSSYFGVSPVILACRDLIELGRALPLPVLCDESILGLLPNAANLLPIETATPRLGIKAFSVATLDEALFEVDSASEDNSDSRSVASGMSAMSGASYGAHDDDTVSVFGQVAPLVNHDISGARNDESVFLTFMNTVRQSLAPNSREQRSENLGVSMGSGLRGRRQQSQRRLLGGNDDSSNNRSGTSFAMDDVLDKSSRSAFSRMSMSRASVRPGAQASKLQRQRHKSIAMPPSLSPLIWNAWKQAEPDASNTVTAEKLWQVVAKLDLEITPERFYEVLQALDSDGSCSIALDDFAAAYRGPVLRGLVILQELKKSLNELAARNEADAIDYAVSVWRDFDPKGQSEVDAETAAEMLLTLNVEVEPHEVIYLVKELDAEGTALRMEDFVALFAPEVSSEDIDFYARRDAVERVMVSHAAPTVDVFSAHDAELAASLLSASMPTAKMSTAPTTTERRIYVTDAQSAEDNARVYAMRFYSMTAPMLFFYVLYIALEAPLACGLCHNKTFAGTFIVRKVSELCFDFLSILWVISKFYLPREVNGRTLVDKADIREAYVGTWEMYADVIAALPLDLAGITLHFVASSEVSDCTLELLRLNKLLYLYHLNSLFSWLASAVLQPSISRITLTIMWWIIVINFFGGAFLTILADVPDSDVVEMLGVERFFEADLVLIFSQAYNWSLFMMVGLSRGPFLSDSDSLVILSFLTVLAGVVSYSLIVSTIINALNVRDSTALFLERMEDVAGFVSYNRVPGETATELAGYYRHMFHSSGATALTYNPLADLPQELAIRIRVQQSLDILGRTSVFRGVCHHAAFMHELIDRLQPRVVMPGEWLVRRGEASTFMCCVSHGQLWVDVDRRNFQKGCTALSAGDFFGAVCLVHSINATSSVCCHDTRYANVFVLHKIEYQNVVRYFPEVVDVVEENVRALLRQSVIDDSNKFAKTRASISCDVEGAVDDYLALHAVSTSNVASIHRAVVDKISSTLSNPAMVK